MEGRQQCLPYFCSKSYTLKFAFKFVPGVIWLGITFWLFTLPGSKIPDIDLFHQLQVDKIVPIFLFVVLCLSFMFPFKNVHYSTQIKRIIFFVLITLFIGYGIVIEFIQRDYIANRSFDIGDIIADSIGCLAALLFAVKYWLKN
jgi:phosphoglycerol transferase MdoB-like AlkP superfamily enzyme